MSTSIEQNVVLIDNFTMPLTNIVINMEKSKEKAKSLSEKVEGVGTSFGKIGKSMTSSFTKPLVSCFNAAATMGTSMQKADSVFGKNSEKVKDWSKTTLNKFGLAKSTSLEMAASFGEMAKGMGVSEDSAYDMSQKLVGLSGDLASFKGISAETASKALGGAFTGQADALKSLGISMDDNTLKQYALSNGYASIYDDMTQAEKAQLRYNFILDKTGKEQGHFANNISSVTNQQQLYQEGIKEVSTAIGQKLLPAGLKLLSFANSLISKFMGLTDSQQDFIIKVAGIAAAIGPVFNVIGKVTTGVGKAIGAFQKISGVVKKASMVFSLLTSPAGIVIAIIAAIAVIALLVYKNWDKIQVAFAKFGKTVNTYITSAGKQLTNFGKYVNSLKNSVVKSITNIIDNFNKFKNKLNAVFIFLVNVFVKGIQKQLAKVSAFFSSMTSSIMKPLISLKNICLNTMTTISNIFSQGFNKNFKNIGKLVGGMINSIVSSVKGPINLILGYINSLITGINKIGIKVPDWVPGIGGKGFSFNIPLIPMLAKGTNNWLGGLAITQERGGEIMDLPRGTRVYPHDKTVRMARMEGHNSASRTININKLADKIEVRSQGDIDAIVEKLAYRLEKIINNGGGEVYA